MIEAYDRIVLSLHRAAREATVDIFQDRSFHALEQLVPFDFGFWIRATQAESGVKLHGSYGYRMPPALKQAWTPLEDRDVIGRMAFAAQGATINISTRDVVSDPVLIQHIIEPFGIAYMLGTCLVDPLTAMVSSVTLVRGPKALPFSESERQLKERVTPHMLEAFSVNRLIQLIEARHPDQRLAYLTAACDAEGLLHLASSEFVALLHREWPGWLGPSLPPEVADLLGASGKTSFRGTAIVVRADAVNDLVWLRARAREPTDNLSPREAEVARLSAAGGTNKAIAQALGLSPFTVRNQLVAIYAKLRVRTRAELAAWVGELDY